MNTDAQTQLEDMNSEWFLDVVNAGDAAIRPTVQRLAVDLRDFLCSRLLVIGCGTGVIERSLLACGIQCCGIDESRFIRVAAERARIGDLPLKYGTSVACIDREVIESVDSLMLVMERLGSMPPLLVLEKLAFPRRKLRARYVLAIEGSADRAHTSFPNQSAPRLFIDVASEGGYSICRLSNIAVVSHQLWTRDDVVVYDDGRQAECVWNTMSDA